MLGTFSDFPLLVTLRLGYGLLARSQFTPFNLRLMKQKLQDILNIMNEAESNSYEGESLNYIWAAQSGLQKLIAELGEEELKELNLQPITYEMLQWVKLDDKQWLAYNTITGKEVIELTLFDKWKATIWTPNGHECFTKEPSKDLLQTLSEQYMKPMRDNIWGLDGKPL